MQNSKVRMISLHLLLFSLSSFGLAQEDFSAVEIKSHHVQGPIYYLEGRGGNIGLSVGEDGVVMIDDQFAPLTDKILAAIRELSDGEIRFLINTHIHGDHTGGNENLGNLGVQILTRDAIRVRLQESGSPAAALPVLTFSENLSIFLNGEETQVISMPAGHTDGDTVIYFTESDVLHVGDVFRTTGFPVIDLTNGGTLQGTLDTLGKIIGMSGPDTKIIPGHGGVSSREDVQVFRDMILDVKSRVAELAREGMSFEEVIAANPTSVYNERYGDPARFLPGVYDGVK